MKKIISIIILFVLGILIFLTRGGSSIFSETIKEFELVESYEKTEKSKFGIFKDNLCHWNDGGIEISNLDKKDKKPLRLGINMEDPIIEYGKNFIYFANPVGGQVYFVNENAELVERIEISREIFNIKEIDSNLVYHVKDGQGESIGIINKKGQKVMSYEFPQGGILNFDLDRTGERLVVSKLEMDGDLIKTKLEFYKSGKVENNIYFQNEIILDVRFINSKDLIILSENNLYRLSGTEILWNKEFNLIKDIAYDGKNLYVLYSNYLEVLDTNGVEKEKLNFEEDYTSIKIKDAGLGAKDIILYSDNRVSVIQANKDIVTKKQPVSQVDFYNEDYFILDNEKYARYKVVKKVLPKEEKEPKENEEDS